MGEPAGIGAELTLKVWLARGDGTPVYFAIGDPEALRRQATDMSLPARIQEIDDPADAAGYFADRLPVLPVALAATARAGRPDPVNAGATIASIERAVSLVRDGHAAAVVTNPVHKKTLYEFGFRHAGLTEFLAELAGAKIKPAMMLACPGLRVVPVTRHLPLARAVAALDTEIIVEQGRIVARALVADFAIARPRLAVAALNPHAGEDGAMGREEQDIIAPAVAALRRDDIDAFGPVPADTLFHERARAGYDAVLCMYHDQALIPLKTVDFAHGINITLGLPFVRTSPDHGVALDIAGRGEADPGALLAALEEGARIAARRDGGDRPAAKFAATGT